MRLHVILNMKEKIQLSKDDFIITNDYNIYDYYKNYKIFLSERADCDLDFTVSENLKKTLEVFSNDTTIFQNTLYSTIYRPVNEILCNVKKIIDNYKIDEIILYGSSKHVFISNYYAEGEGKKFIYESSWMMNSLIEKCFSRDIIIKWKKKKSSSQYYLLNYFRYQIIHFKILLLYVLKSLTSLWPNKFNKRFVSKNKSIALSSLPLQYYHLKSLLANQQDKVLYLVPRKHRMKIYGENILYYRKNNLLDFIIILFKTITFFKAKCKNTKLYFMDESINIKTSLLKRDLKILFFEYLYKKNEIIKTLEYYCLENAPSFVTNMTYGIDIQTIHEISNQFNIKHVNFQYVSMAKMAIPNLDLADEYYMYSLKTKDFYCAKNSTFKFYMPLAEPKKLFKSRDTALSVTIFTQPDRYTSKYINMVRLIANKIKNLSLNIKLTLKLHYRQDQIEKFIELKNKFDFIEISNNKPVSETIENSDIIISITSSVLFEAMILGVVGFIVDIQGLEQNYIYNNDGCYPEVNFYMTTIQEVIDGILNYKELKKEYINRLNEFKLNYQGDFDFEKILKL